MALSNAVSSQRPSLMLRLNTPGLFEFGDKPVEAIGEAVDIEIRGIVVAVGNFGVDGGVNCRNEPFASAHAGDRVEQRQLVVFRGRRRCASRGWAR
jgi:hypothetical protein